MVYHEPGAGYTAEKAVTIAEIVKGVLSWQHWDINQHGKLSPSGWQLVITDVDVIWSIAMSQDNGNGSVTWIEIRDASNKLLFKYDPVHNAVEIKPKQSDAYLLIRLDEIRLKHGYTPVDLNIVLVREYIAVDVAKDQSSVPYSTPTAPTQKPKNRV
jgi:hypothetical protein